MTKTLKDFLPVEKLKGMFFFDPKVSFRGFPGTNDGVYYTVDRKDPEQEGHVFVTRYNPATKKEVDSASTCLKWLLNHKPYETQQI